MYSKSAVGGYGHITAHSIADSNTPPRQQRVKETNINCSLTFVRVVNNLNSIQKRTGE